MSQSEHQSTASEEARLARGAEVEQHHAPVEEVGFMVVHYRRQHGVPKAYVTTTLDEWLRGQGL